MSVHSLYPDKKLVTARTALHSLGWTISVSFQPFFLPQELSPGQSVNYCSWTTGRTLGITRVRNNF
ncbi:MAG: hypothetical protein ACFFD4_13415 [Candidatus Odinarchaeota archaeon]